MGKWNIYCHPKLISSNQLFSISFSKKKNGTFTKFCLRSVSFRNFRTLHCAKFNRKFVKSIFWHLFGPRDPKILFFATYICKKNSWNQNVLGIENLEIQFQSNFFFVKSITYICTCSFMAKCKMVVSSNLKCHRLSYQMEKIENGTNLKKPRVCLLY